MKAVFYPGCTFKTAAGYKESFEEVNKVLGIELEEVDDWNCCGATAYFSLNKLQSLVLPARNIAKSEDAHWIITPCNACYATLRKAKAILANDIDLREKVKEALSEEGLTYRGKPAIRHVLDYYLLPEVFEKVKANVVKPLTGLRVACYYGCQYTRPQVGDETDHPEAPTNLDTLMEALGAEVVDYSAKTYCCGAAQMVGHEDGCLRLVNRILKAAEQAQADVIVTLCPLCQFNVDYGAEKLGKSIPVLFFTQLMGLAFGIPHALLGMKKLLVPADAVLTKI